MTTRSQRAKRHKPGKTEYPFIIYRPPPDAVVTKDSVTNELFTHILEKADGWSVVCQMFLPKDLVLCPSCRLVCTSEKQICLDNNKACTTWIPDRKEETYKYRRSFFDKTLFDPLSYRGCYWNESLKGVLVDTEHVLHSLKEQVDKIAALPDVLCAIVFCYLMPASFFALVSKKELRRRQQHSIEIDEHLPDEPDQGLKLIPWWLECKKKQSLLWMRAT